MDEARAQSPPLFLLPTIVHLGLTVTLSFFRKISCAETAASKSSPLGPKQNISQSELKLIARRFTLTHQNTIYVKLYIYTNVLINHHCSVAHS